MAGEWLPYDVCLPQKPEVLELVDRTGLEVDQVVGRLVNAWNAWRRDTTTDLKYHAQAKIPAAV